MNLRRISQTGLLTTVWVSIATAPSLAASLVGYSLEFSSPNFNTPTLTLTNTSTVESIVGFTLALEQTEFNFDAYQSFFSSPGITQTLNRPDSDYNGGLRADDISLSFTGFTPGRSTRSTFDIDQDSSDTIEDYRTILFDLNGSEANNNALVTVLFSGGGSLSSRLPDFAQTDDNV